MCNFIFSIFTVTNLFFTAVKHIFHIFNRSLVGLLSPNIQINKYKVSTENQRQ